MRRKWCLIGYVAILASLGALPLSAQNSKERAIEQYECKDVMRDSGADREVAIAFLHGFLLGKSGTSKFNTESLRQQTDAFIEQCLMNPTKKAVDVMVDIKR